MSCPCAHGERFLPSRLLAVFFHQRDGKRDFGDVVGLLPSVRVSELAFHAELVFSLELLLGAAIAAGWLMRYASTLVVVGTIAAVPLQGTR